MSPATVKKNEAQSAPNAPAAAARKAKVAGRPNHAASKSRERRKRLGLDAPHISAAPVRGYSASVPRISSNFQDLCNSIKEDNTNEDDITPRYADDWMDDTELQMAMMASMQTAMTSSRGQEQNDDAALAAAIQASLAIDADSKSRNNEPLIVDPPYTKRDGDGDIDSATAALLSQFKDEDRIAREMPSASEAAFQDSIASIVGSSTPAKNPFDLLDVDGAGIDNDMKALLAQLASAGEASSFTPVNGAARVEGS